jgi:AcrR family transcriptional regulator
VGDQPNRNAGLRHALSGSRDPRAARTRAAIREAVHELAARGAETISASDVIRAAGVSRGSFYAHFAGLDELSVDLLEHAFAEISDSYGELLERRGGSTADALRASQELLVDHFAAHRGFYASVFGLSSSQGTYLAGVRAMARVMEPRLSAQRPADLDPTVAARYSAGAAFGLLHAWVCGELDLSAGQLVDHLVALLPDWFRQDASDRPGELPGHGRTHQREAVQ